MALKAASDLRPQEQNSLLYSILIPAYNEENNIRPTIESVAKTLRREQIPFEILVVNDNSADSTAQTVLEVQREYPEVRMVHNVRPGGLGRAIRFGLQHYRGEAVAIVMADQSDDPEDVARCYRKMEEGYDCAFGSRFMAGSSVTDYPAMKLVFNRLGNTLIRLMFLTRHNDLTNAFKCYRRHVIDGISPLHACHFNITIEMSLSALIRRYSIAVFPIRWSGRNWGVSNLRIWVMGRRYICTLLKIWFERLLILDDLMADMDSRGAR
ncbi:MAG: glycosyltransferase family 2 protein [Candidatus Hydrogenedentes bacterium]|nr:glycosyltransferase family 2 protein [Candidatus Hydrogenedentota bacterium]